jgi:MFS transporter
VNRTPALAWSARSALRFVLLFGAVNLFADWSYEGARSITGPFLGLLGASGIAVGLAAGGGELLGYTLRLVSGRLVDRSRAYWGFAFAGYFVQMAAVPALAIAGSWQAAAALMILERTGRALRKPGIAVMLSGAGEIIGRGWAFALDEALDQCGAMLGPLTCAWVLARRHNYHLAFAWLGLPALAVLILVLSARLLFPESAKVIPKGSGHGGSGYPPAFWWYLAASALVGFGFADWSLMAYHYSRAHTISEPWVPIFYAATMGAGGLGALLFGKLYDQRGLVVLVPLTLLTAASAPLAFLGGPAAAFAGSLLWGIGLGVHESIMAAAVASMVPAQRLGGAYGLFTACFGLAWFVGSAVLGALYDVSVPALVGIAAAAQIAAILPLIAAVKRIKSPSDF